MYTVHIPMFNDENFVHRVSKIFLLLKICTLLYALVNITTDCSMDMDRFLPESVKIASFYIDFIQKICIVLLIDVLTPRYK